MPQTGESWGRGQAKPEPGILHSVRQREPTSFSLMGKLSLHRREKPDSESKGLRIISQVRPPEKAGKRQGLAGRSSTWLCLAALPQNHPGSQKHLFTGAGAPARQCFPVLGCQAWNLECCGLLGQCLLIPRSG